MYTSNEIVGMMLVLGESVKIRMQQPSVTRRNIIENGIFGIAKEMRRES